MTDSNSTTTTATSQEVTKAARQICDLARSAADILDEGIGLRLEMTPAQLVALRAMMASIGAIGDSLGADYCSDPLGWFGADNQNSPTNKQGPTVSASHILDAFPQKLRDALSPEELSEIADKYAEALTESDYAGLAVKDLIERNSEAITTYGLGKSGSDEQ